MRDFIENLGIVVFIIALVAGALALIVGVPFAVLAGASALTGGNLALTIVIYLVTFAVLFAAGKTLADKYRDR